MAQRRSNVVPIIEDARMPNKYRMLVQQVDGLFSDVAQPDQTEIVMKNAKMFLKSSGWLMIAVKVIKHFPLKKDFCSLLSVVTGQFDIPTCLSKS